MGCYIPPSDLATLDHIRGAVEHRPAGTRLLVLGDLNADLLTEHTVQDAAIADFLEGEDLQDLSRHFRVRKRPGWKGKMVGRWTWRGQLEGRWVRSQPDYILASEQDRRRFRRIKLRWPRGHGSDHRVVIATMKGGSAARLRRYRKERRMYPLRMEDESPSELETVFAALQLQRADAPAHERT